MAAITFKCPNCGGELLFEPSKQKYACPYCSSEFTQQELDEMTPVQGQEYEKEPEEAPSHDASGDLSSASSETAEENAQAVVYSCPSCGAQIVTDETTAATFCYYCHNPVVLEGRLSGDYLPDEVIPFKISREKAVEQFLQFTGSRKYVPKAFFNQEQIEKLTGVYYHYWVYEADVDAQIDAEANKIRVWRVGETEYTETSIFAVERAGTASFKNLTRNALRKANGELVEKVQPYRFKDLTAFSMGYLSGFQAEKRDMEKGEFEQELRKETAQYAQNLLRNSAGGYSSLRIRNSRHTPVKEAWHYVLLPVWVLTYQSLSGKMYYYAMNGQTGNVTGELPLDTKKLALHCILLGLVIFALAMAGGYFV